MQTHVKQLLSGRRTGHLVAEGQGVLFPLVAALHANEGISEQGDGQADETAGGSDDDDDADDDDQPRSRNKAKRRSKKKLDISALSRVEHLHELPEEERFCPDTGLPLIPIGEKTFDEIDFQRAKVSIIHHRQTIYGIAPEHAEDQKSSPVTMPLPPRPLEDCAASANLLAWILVQKYANHLPLYRQEQIFARDGLRLSRKTLCDWVLGAAEALRPVASGVGQKFL